MNNRWNKTKIRWKFMWLCSLVLLLQFVISSTYLYNQSARLLKEQGEDLLGKYLAQSEGGVRNELKNVVSSANLLVNNDSFQEYMRKYAIRYFEYNNASIDFQFDVVHMFRSIIAQTSNIKELRIFLEDNTIVLSQNAYSNTTNDNLSLFNDVTSSPRSNIGWRSSVIGGQQSVFYRMPLSATGKTSGIRGWIDVVVRPDTVFQAVGDQMNSSEPAEQCVADKSGTIIYSKHNLTDRSILNCSLGADLSKQKEASIHKVNGSWKMVKMSRITGTDWLLLSSINEQSFRLDIINYIRNSILILLVPILVLATGIMLTTNVILKPLRQLVAAMSNINQDYITHQIETNRQDEFGILTTRFNKMMRRIDEQIMTIRTTEQLRRQAEIGAFQSQIRQHFLYNTLALISWTARKEKAGETERIANLFARFYRLALSKGETYIPFHREMELIRHYLDIQSCRFVDQLSYEIRVEASIDGYVIMRNILQPLVENAVEHGVLSKKHGTVLVQISEDSDFLIIRVMDDGAGADPEIVRRINEGIPFEGEQGFSLYSIKKNLHFFYHSEAVFDFLSVVNSGTVVTVKLLKARMIKEC